MTTAHAELYQQWHDSGMKYIDYWKHHLEDEMSYQSFRCKMYRVKQKVEYTPDVWRVDFGKPLTIACDDAIIVGDVQIPTTDFDFALLPGMIATKYLKRGKRTLIIAGDLFNLDGFSKYERTVSLPTIRQELAAARELLKEWLRVFDRIYVFAGNHERRLSKLTGASLDLEHLMSFVTSSDKVHVSNWGHMTIKASTGAWRVTHGTNYSVNQLSVPDVYAQKYGCHIISHHEHHLAQGWDRFKRHIVIANGGLFDQQKMSYVVYDDNRSPNMAQGFTMLKDGFPTVFGKEPFTNWSQWI